MKIKRNAKNVNRFVQSLKAEYLLLSGQGAVSTIAEYYEDYININGFPAIVKEGQRTKSVDVDTYKWMQEVAEVVESDILHAETTANTSASTALRGLIKYIVATAVIVLGIYYFYFKNDGDTSDEGTDDSSSPNDGGPPKGGPPPSDDDEDEEDDEDYTPPPSEGGNESEYSSDSDSGSGDEAVVSENAVIESRRRSSKLLEKEGSKRSCQEGKFEKLTDVSLSIKIGLSVEAEVPFIVLPRTSTIESKESCLEGEEKLTDTSVLTEIGFEDLTEVSSPTVGLIGVGMSFIILAGMSTTD